VLYVAPADDRSGPWLWTLDVERRETHRVSKGLERYLSVAASATGRRLAASVVTQSTAGLWSVPLGDHEAQESEIKPVQPAGRALAPRFAAGSLFYLSSSGPGDGLWRFDVGKPPQEIWNGSKGVLLESPSVSPRGDRAAVVLRKEGKLHLTLVPIDGSGSQLLNEDIDVRGTSAWSPNGERIVTGGSDAQGAGLFMITVRDGTYVRLTKGAAFDPVWSPTEDLIVYSAQQSATGPLLAVRSDKTKVDLPNVSVPLGGGGRVRFLPNGKGLVYLHGPVGEQDFYRLDFGTKQTSQLTRLSNPATIYAFDITPDGTRIVFDRVRENSDIRLIDLPKK
jgi:Tol biopolymer transport system component